MLLKSKILSKTYKRMCESSNELKLCTCWEVDKSQPYRTLRRYAWENEYQMMGDS